MAVIPVVGRDGLSEDTVYGKLWASLRTVVVAAAQLTAPGKNYLNIGTRIKNGKREARYIPGGVNSVRFPRTIVTWHE